MKGAGGREQEIKLSGAREVSEITGFVIALSYELGACKPLARDARRNGDSQCSAIPSASRGAGLQAPSSWLKV